VNKFEAHAASTEWKHGALPSILAGAIAAVASQRLVAAYGLEESFVSWGLAAFFFFVSALTVGRLYGAASGFNMISIGIGIAVGTIVESMIIAASGVDPNLWPIAIVILWIVGCIPVVVGVVFGTLWRKWSMKNSVKPTL
jgi:hypothetical protein